MKNNEVLVDWMLGVAAKSDKTAVDSLWKLKEVFPTSVKKHIAVADALLNDPPEFLVKRWQAKAKKAKVKASK